MAAKKKSAPKPKAEETVEVVEEVVEASATRCDNHPDVDAIWSSDGVLASVINLCGECRPRGV